MKTGVTTPIPPGLRAIVGRRELQERKKDVPWAYIHSREGLELLGFS
jgi:hypothetical protein